MAVFKPRARLLKLLGEQLIGTPQLAIFELVKNSYDADADSVDIVIKYPEDQEKTIIVIKDFNGEGMTKNTIENIWLEPGADHRYQEKQGNKRTKKYNRLPLGEKGVGRFAVHKLGHKIKLITKAKNEPELSLTIDWEQLEKVKYMEDFKVNIEENIPPKEFKNNETGTQIEISKLTDKLTRSDVRNLYRNVESIKSPFEHTKFKLESSTPNFQVNMIVEGKESWTSDLYDIEDILLQAMFKFAFCFENGIWSWDYEFNPNMQLKEKYKIESNHCRENDAIFQFSDKALRAEYKSEKYNDLGVIFGEIYVFDFDKEVKDFYEQTGFIKTFLSENKGIRVYRDGLRVYNYGEPHDDWLEMDSRRVNRLSVGLNRNITVGGISINLEDTPDLIEKTNREGFIENDTYIKFRNVIANSLSQFEKLRNLDKQRLRTTTTKKGESVTSIDDPIGELRKIVKDKKLEELFEPKIKAVEKNYNQMRDTMLDVGLAGLNMSIAFHEIYRGIKDAKNAIKTGINKEKILEHFGRFELLLDVYARMLKKEKVREYSVKELLKGNLELANVRLKLHSVLNSCPVLVGDQSDLKVKMPVNMMTSVINNIIDNSIFWLDQRWGNDKGKYLYIGVDSESFSGPAIVIADNGTGFKNISANEMIAPFLTTKPGGMGLGLYYANTVMQMLGGELLLLENTEADIPDAADGAIVVLVFKEEK